MVEISRPLSITFNQAQRISSQVGLAAGNDLSELGKLLTTRFCSRPSDSEIASSLVAMVMTVHESLVCMLPQVRPGSSLSDGVQAIRQYNENPGYMTLNITGLVGSLKATTPFAS